MYDPCKDCGETDFVEDYRHGDVICTFCGLCVPSTPMVCDSITIISKVDKDRYSIERETAGKRPSADYSRVYHANEIFAQWCNTGPRLEDTHPEILELFDKFSLTEGSRDVRDWDHTYIKELCKKFGNSKVGECWIQIKRHCCGEALSDPPPPAWLVNKLRRHIALLSNAFDRTLYKPGKRKTNKDDAYIHKPNIHPLARHNFLHSGFLLQTLLRWEGALEEVNGTFYFPDIKTKSVKRKTRAMFDVLLQYLGWTFENGPYSNSIVPMDLN